MHLSVTPIPSNTLSYWLNWRVSLCAICVFIPMIVALIMIRKYESGCGSRRASGGKTIEEGGHASFATHTWSTCHENIHPIWLLAYRIVAFSLLLTTLIVKVSMSGFLMFFYYTQWTFTLLTIYFGIGSMLSAYGCYHYYKLGGTESNSPNRRVDTEQGIDVPLLHEERTGMTKLYNSNKELSDFPAATCILLFQVIFQMSAGAVMLTDCVYWSLIFPFLTIRDYTLNFMTVNMHTVNAVLLLGDTALNKLQFPWFRMAYFILWTGVFVIFQWIFHACVPIWWPYPFLDLSSSYAPLWYLLIASMHLPCYGIFVLIIKMKNDILSRSSAVSHGQRL